MSIFIQHPDPGLAAGGKYAVTGETAEEYTRRLKNQSEHSFDTNIKEHVYDKDFVVKLPYTFTENLEELTASGDNANELAERAANLKNEITTASIFLENLNASLGENNPNDSVKTVREEIVKDYIQKRLHITELNTTELGGNDALNCYWSFNENDDIVYPGYALDPKDCTLGLGRVYYEMYQSKQVILWLTFGVPKYCGIVDFYTQAYNPKLAAEMHSGTSSTAGLIGRVVGGALTFSFRLATLPLYVLHQIGKTFTTYTITKYYELNVTMPLYFRAINNMMGVVAVNMGIQQSSGIESETDSNGNPVEGNVVDGDKKSYNVNDLPSMLREGLSIYSILAKRPIYFARKEGREIKSEEEILEMFETIQGDPTKFEDPDYSAGSGIHFIKSLGQSFMANVSGSTAYIGFRIEKSVDASESISNSTGQSELQQTLNSFKQQTANISFNTMGGAITGGVIGEAAQALKGFVNGALDAVSFDMHGLVTGTGYFDIPEVWKESSFSATHSFSTKLVSHYCDRVSIFQNCYVPLFCLLAAALPRQVGNNTYVEPFLCRAYCKGRFAITLGIIDSMTIKRGRDEFGWTEEGFPTQIDVSWTIKDLSPLLFMGLSGANGGSNFISDFFKIFQSNNSMQEYLSTLGGIGLKERVMFLPNIQRKFKAWWNVNFSTKLLNPYYWGTTIGSIPMLQTALAWKFSRLSSN